MSEITSASESNENSGQQIKPSDRGKSRWVLKSFFAIVILTCGIVIGIVITVSFVRDRLRNFQFQPEVATSRVMSRFDSRYNLKDQQRDAIEKVVREHFDSLEKIGQEVHPRILFQMETFGKKVSAELDDEQRKDWQERYQHIRKNFLPQKPFREKE